MADIKVTAPVEVRGLSVAYGGVAALTDITWAAPPSGLVGVVGPNGAGKSTLLKALLGLVPVTSGKTLINGEPVERQYGSVAYVPQRSSVDWDFPATALDVVAMGLYRRIGWLRPVRRADRLRALGYLETVGLSELANRQIGALSGGQQQRVFIARALAQETRLYFLDEPFAGVDATTEQIMINVFRDLRAKGCLVICVHHDLPSVPKIFDHVVLLNRKLIAAGPVAATFTPPLVAEAYGVPLDAANQAAMHEP